MYRAVTKSQLRSFGVTVGGIFGVIGLWPLLFRGEELRWWALVLTVLLVIPALAIPRILQPFYRCWMGIGQLLGWINTRIILGALFFTVFSFGGFMLRIMGKDPMQRKFNPGAKTYRIPRQLRPASHMEHQF